MKKKYSNTEKKIIKELWFYCVEFCETVEDVKEYLEKLMTE